MKIDPKLLLATLLTWGVWRESGPITALAFIALWALNEMAPPTSAVYQLHIPTPPPPGQKGRRKQWQTSKWN